MSGIVGSKLNIRGSGLVGSLGTDGQHLLSSGVGKTNTFETVSASADWVKLHHSELVSGDVSEIQVTEVFSATYQVYKIFISRYFGPQYGKFAFLVDTTTQTSSYLMKGVYISGTATTGANSPQVFGFDDADGCYTNFQMALQDAVGDNSGRTTDCEITVFNPIASDLQTNAIIADTGSGDDNYYGLCHTGLSYQNTTAINGFEIVAVTDNIVNCMISVYGLKV